MTAATNAVMWFVLENDGRLDRMPGSTWTESSVDGNR